MIQSIRSGAYGAAVMLCCLFGTIQSAHARSETIRWTHEKHSTVEFYRVHVGPGPRQYTRTIPVGKTLSHRLALADNERAYVAVTAHAGSTTSGYSNEKRLDPPAAASAPPSPSAPPPESASGSSASARLLLGVPVSQAVPLAGEVVAGAVLIHVEASRSVASVAFYLDDPSMKGSPRQVERVYTYDFAGTWGSPPVRKPFDTRTIADGGHTVTAKVTYKAGNVDVLQADFEVANQAPASPPPPPPAPPAASPPPPAAPPPTPRPEPAPPTSSQGGGSSANAALLLGVPVSNAVPLDGQVVRGDVFIHVESSQPVDRVAFFLDDPTRKGAPRQTERVSPYDFAGTWGSPPARSPFDTSTVADGWHTVTAAVTYSSGATETLHADFEVRNGGGGSATSAAVFLEPALQILPSTADPTAPGEPLQGALVAGPVFIFVSDPGQIKRVKFYLDDPLRAGPPARIEAIPPYDWAGTRADGTPNAFDSRSLSDGTHTLTAEIEWTAGGSSLVHADFLVANRN